MDNHDQSRRQWLNGLLRAGLLSIVAAVSAVLLRRAGGTADGRCELQNPCGHCGRLARCQLPQALNWKQR